VSLWDDFKKTVTPFVQTLTGQGTDLTGRAPINQPTNQIMPQLTPAKALEVAATPVEKAYETAYSYGVSRPLTTLMLGADPGANYVNKDVAGALNNIKARWNASAYVSPSQEIVAGFNNYIGDGSNSWLNHDPGSALSPREQVNNAMLKQQKLNHFQDNWLANAVSGASDAVFMWFLDPLVIGTKAASSVKAANRLKQLGSEAEQVLARKGGAWEFIRWATRETDAGVINQRLKGTNPVLASALAASKDEKTTSLIWMASRGDQAALNTLKSTQASVGAQIENLSSTLGFAKFGGYPEGMLTPGLEAELADLKLLDTELNKAIDTAGTNVFISRGRQDLSIALGQTVEKEQGNIQRAKNQLQARTGYGEEYSQYTKKVYQRGVGIRPVIVWEPNNRFLKARQAVTTFISGKATGIFHLQGHNASDGSNELIANLSTGPLRKVFNGEEANVWNQRYLDAPNTTEQSKVLQELEDEAVKRLFQQSLDTLDPVTYQKLWVDGVLNRETAINDVVAHVRTKKNEVVDRIVRRDKGKFPDDNGSINVMKIWDTQTPDTFVMLNWDATARAFRNVVRDELPGHRNIKELLAAGYDWFMSMIWRPDVLFRLGYTIRNVGEGALRIISVSDAMMGAQVSGAGGRIVRNRGIGWTAQRLGKDVDALTADHLNELDGIIATRLQFRGINAKDFNSGNFTMPKNTTLDSIYDEQDALLASRQSVIENFLSEGRYRLGSDKESYLGVTYDAAFAGNGGRFLRDLSSAGQTKASELAGGKNVVQDFEVKIPGAKRGFKWSDTSSRISRGNTSYVPTLTNIINHQWRNSPLAKRLLNGESDYVVIEWLRSADREAVYVRRELGISKSEAGQAVSDAAEVMRRYMPDPSLRAIAATRDVRMGEIEKSIKAFEKVDNEAYGTIVGKELILNDKLPSAWRRGLNRVYHYIGSLPEDVFLRHPFTKMKYDQYMQQSIDDLQRQGVTHVDNQTLEQYGRAARAYALREVKRTLYTIERYSSLSEHARFVAPFYAAFENTGKTWARIMANDLKVGAHFLQVANAPTQAGLVVDENGQPVEYRRGQLPSKNWSIQFQVPKVVADKVPAFQTTPTVNINLKSLNVVFQGETPITPGLGPLVQIPVSELTKNFQNGFTNWLSEATLTGGVSKSPLSWNLLAGTTLRRVVSYFQKNDAVDYSRDLGYFAQQIRADHEKRGEPVPPNLLDLAKKQADTVYGTKIAIALLSPAALQLNIKPEYKQAIDSYRLYQRQGIVDGLTPGQRFSKDFPEYFAWTLSTSENQTGVNATRSARSNIQRYKGLFDSVLETPGVDPGIVGWIVNNPEDLTYDQTVAAWQTGREVVTGTDIYYRSTKSTLDSINRPYVAEGWNKYIAMVNLVNAGLKNNNFTSINQKGAEDIAAYKRDYVTYLKDNFPQWYAEYRPPSKAKYAANAKAMELVISDKRFSRDKKNNSSVQVLSEYLSFRKRVIDTLDAKKKSGKSGTLTSKENEPLLNDYTAFVSWMNNESPTAFEVYSRFFDGEFGQIDDPTQQDTIIGGA